MIKRVKNNKFLTITHVSRSGGRAMVRTAEDHGLITGDIVDIECSDTTYNATQVEAIVSNNTARFDYNNLGDDENEKEVTGTIGVNKNWVGVTIRAGEYYDIPLTESLQWASDTNLLSDITSGIAVINNGDKDIETALEAINWLKGDVAQTVEIKEENIPTGAHYRAYFGVLEAAPGQTVTKDISFPFPISIMAGGVAAPNDGDEVALNVAPDTILGQLVEAAAIGAVTLKVPQTVIDNVEVGYILDLEEGITLNRFYVAGIGSDYITIDPALSNAFTASALIKFTRRFFHTNLHDLAIISSRIRSIGMANIKASYVPKNKIIRAIYKNNSDVASQCHYFFEYYF